MYSRIIFTPGQLLKAAHLNHMEEGIINNSTFNEELLEGNNIVLENNTEYHTNGDLAALTVSVPETIDESFHCSLDFGSGETATAFTYPATVKWSGDHLDASKNFVPIRNHRYHVDFWYDGYFIRGNASGVIV